MKPSRFYFLFYNHWEYKDFGLGLILNSHTITDIRYKREYEIALYFGYWIIFTGIKI